VRERRAQARQLIYHKNDTDSHGDSGLIGTAASPSFRRGNDFQRVGARARHGAHGNRAVERDQAIITP